jgi:hypothetical protein
MSHLVWAVAVVARAEAISNPNSARVTIVIAVSPSQFVGREPILRSPAMAWRKLSGIIAASIAYVFVGLDQMQGARLSA